MQDNHSLSPTSRLMPSHFLSNAYLSQNPFPFFIAEHDITYMAYSFGLFESAIQVVSPSNSWPPLAYLLRGQNEKKRKSWQCASAAQQQPKHSCVINALLATNPKQFPYRLLWRILTPSQLDPMQQYPAI